MGDTRTYENICLLRAVTSEDGMTADYFSLPKNFIDKISVKVYRILINIYIQKPCIKSYNLRLIISKSYWEGK